MSAEPAAPRRAVSRSLLAIVVALLAGAAGYHFLVQRQRADGADPLLVMVTQMRTRALIEHEREIAVWYRSCPSTPGIDPQVLVIWPGKLSYELDLSQTRIERRGEGLYVRTPPIRADEPQVPTELGEYVASSSIWTLESDQTLVLDEMKKASPLARHLSVFYLKHDPSLTARFRDELEAFLRSLAGALGVPARTIEIEIPATEAVVPARPTLALCEGSTALANGTPFVRRTPDGEEAGVYPSRPD